MTDLIQKALNAKRESKRIEFKRNFDTESAQQWCEIIKDIVAIANSGGGIILFGVDNLGIPCRTSIANISSLDSADVVNKISKYTDAIDLEIEIYEVKKRQKKLIAFLIHPLAIPVVFRKPGTYDIGGGKQRNAFSVGTIYFRHGAKSEPGTREDIRKVIERQLEFIRKSWAKNVRKVVQAPQGSQIVMVQPSIQEDSSTKLSSTVHAVKDPHATPVLLTRDEKKAVGTFVHEEVSEGIFDEINNVIDANSALAKGQQHFFLGQPVYFRIYAERHHVQQTVSSFRLLLNSAVHDFYAPGLYWLLNLTPKDLSKTIAELYLYPKSPNVYYLIRLAILLGKECYEWLHNRWQDKWENHPQPPSFYWTFREMISLLDKYDSLFVATRTTPSSKISVLGGNVVLAKSLLTKPESAATMLSKACMAVFEGNSKARAVARNLDFFAYGLSIRRKASQITNAILSTIGDREAGDFLDRSDKE